MFGLLIVPVLPGCGLDRFGEELMRDDRSSDAPVVCSSCETRDETGALVADGETESPPPREADLSGQDASLVGQDADSLNAPDASSEAATVGDSPWEAPDDGPTVCGRLMQCCPRLLAPPLVLTCLAVAQQHGAGDGGSCESELGTVEDAGLCP